MRSKFFPALFCGALTALAACDEPATGPDGAELTAAEATALAVGFDNLGLSILDGFTGGAMFSTSAAEPQNVDVQFNRTHACPKGGSFTIAGQTKGTADRETYSLNTTTTATKTQKDCTWEAREGTTLTVSGSLALNATRKIENGKPVGVQATTQKGSFTWTRSTGETGTCTVDLTSTFNPDTRTHAVSGTLCNRQISKSRSRS